MKGLGDWLGLVPMALFLAFFAWLHPVMLTLRWWAVVIYAFAVVLGSLYALVWIDVRMRPSRLRSALIVLLILLFGVLASLPQL